jgi:hypothetical protein
MEPSLALGISEKQDKMMSVVKAAKWLACLSLLLPLHIQGHGQLLAGAAKALITPDLTGKKVYLAGFGHNRIATAVHDPLYVRCAALQVGKPSASVVLCVADLIGLFYEDVVKIRSKFHEQSKSDALLIVACTHVHEGPDTLGLWGPSALETGVDLGYLEWVEDRISQTAVAALRAMEPARLRLGRDDHPLLEQLQSVDRPPYVKDPYLHVLQLQRASDAKVIATLVSWSDHPETLNRKNTEITADYPGWICRYLEERYGGTALMFNSAVGKVSTLGAQVALLDPLTGQVAEDGAWRKPELLGTLIGQLAGRALAKGETAMPSALTTRSLTFFLPLSNDRFRAALAAGVFSERRPLFTAGKRDPGVAEREMDHQTVRYATGHDLQSEVDYVGLRAGSRILAEFVTIPGEIFPELVNGGIAHYPGADYPDASMEVPVRSLLKSKYQFLIGLGNDEMGYIIPKAEWDELPPWLNNSPRAYYGEINSPGPETAPALSHALAELIARKTVRSGPSGLR